MAGLALKGTIAGSNGSIPRKLKMQAFSSWYDQTSARGFLRNGQSRDDYLAEFLNACKRAKIPLGSSPAERAWALAATEPLPAEAAAFETQNAKLLVAFCYQLDRLSGTEPWFLSFGTAARLLGVTRPTAGKLLTAMVELGIIQVVKVNTSTKATRYRYLHSVG